MDLHVEIDKDSGFCAGVIRAIGRAEEYLDAHSGSCLFSLGPIVHNEAELSRLKSKGLTCISLEDIGTVDSCGGTVPLLIRAHGEPPTTYESARRAGFPIIDCTCPVVLTLQKRIREAYERLHCRGGQIIIFGKVGHAEILGLVGQVNGDAVVVEDVSMLRGFVLDGTVRTDVPVEIFSQTTKDPDEYRKLCDEAAVLIPDIVVHNTICTQVASRHSRLSAFSRNHDVIVFVTGKQSSNGRVLSDLCLKENPRTHIVGNSREVCAEWFRNGDTVGVCGATSTPKWLLEDVSEYIENLQ